MIVVTLIPILLLVASVNCAEPRIDDVLDQIFGPSPTSTPSVVNNNNKIRVKPAVGTVIGVNSEGKKCECVPYYQCEQNETSFQDAGRDGDGLLDFSFSKDEPRVCPDYMDVMCCTAPKPIEDRPLFDVK